MAIIETFIAYDEQENEYKVNVHGTVHRPISGQQTMATHYSLASTGEVLQIIDKPTTYLIKSTNTVIVDIRGINV